MCEHKTLRAVGDRIFCKDCGQEVDMAFLLAQNGPKKAVEDDKPVKAPAKKRAAKKAE